MSPDTSKNHIAQFLLSQVDPALNAAYEILASFQYPIPDKKTLHERLSNIEEVKQEYGDADQASTISISNALTPFDFPITTAQGALEKFHARLFAPAIPDPRDEPVFVPPDPFFGDDPCGRAAKQLYDRIVAEDSRFLPINVVRRGAYNNAKYFLDRCRARNR